MSLPGLTDSVELVVIDQHIVNVKVKGKLLHSARNTEKEFDRFLAQIKNRPESESVLLIGVGALFDRLSELNAGCKVTLYEPIIELQTVYANLGRFQFCEPTTDLDQFDAIIVYPSYKTIFTELGRFERTKATQSNTVDEATTRHFLRQWLRNYSIHLQSDPVRFFDRFVPDPTDFVFCGAAPSLLADLEQITGQLQTANRKPVILAADTAAAAIVNAGYTIDLVISIDSGYGTDFHLTALKSACLAQKKPLPPLLTWLCGNSFSAKAGFTVLYAPTMFPADQVLSTEHTIGRPFLNRFRNVLGYAHAIKERHNDSQLFFAGVSFEPVGGQYYVTGSGYDLYGRSQQHRLHTLEGYHSKLARQQKTANRLAKAQLSPAKAITMSKTTEIRTFLLQSTLFSTDKLQKTICQAVSNRLFQQEFGKHWAALTDRYFSFCN